MTSGSTAPEREPTREFARFIATLDGGSLPRSVREHLQGALLDTLRVASLGERAPWSEWARALARDLGGRERSTVLFGGGRTDPERATFVNATYAGSLDADDVHVGAMLHPGCVVIPAALAVGEAAGATGREVIAAIAAGYETMIRIALAIQPTHFRRGFQSTATCGVFGAAAAAASLLARGADRETRIAGTLGLAASFSGGLTQFYHSGSTVKRIHAAHAAREGVHAAQLAAAGFDGPVDILEGRDGYARAYADGHDFSIALDGLGSRWRLLETAVKPHACSARVLSAIEAAATLAARHEVRWQDLSEVRVGIPAVIQGRLTSGSPSDLQAAQMSLPFCVAMALVRGGWTDAGVALGLDDFDGALADPRVRDLAKRIVCEPDPEAEQASTAESVGARVTLAVGTGERWSLFVPAPAGSASRPLALPDHRARFARELARRCEPAALEALLESVCTLESQPGVDDLLARLGEAR